MNRIVAAIIAAIVNDPKFFKLIKENILPSVDTEGFVKTVCYAPGTALSDSGN